MRQLSHRNGNDGVHGVEEKEFDDGYCEQRNHHGTILCAHSCIHRYRSHNFFDCRELHPCTDQVLVYVLSSLGSSQHESYAHRFPVQTVCHEQHMHPQDVRSIRSQNHENVQWGDHRPIRPSQFLRTLRTTLEDLFRSCIHSD